MTQTKTTRIAGFKNPVKKVSVELKEMDDSTQTIENHLKAAEHFTQAARYHRDAATYHEEGNHQMAHSSALLAIGHAYMANENQWQDAKHHALERNL